MEYELYWAAGFFDGEGNSFSHRSGKNWYPNVNIGQTDIEVLERFQKAVGVGKIYGPYEDKNPNASVIWRYIANGSDAIEVMSKIYPYLSSIKRTQWDETIRTSKVPKRRGYCGKDLHMMTDDNTTTDGKCRECMNARKRADYWKRKELENGTN